MQNTKLLELFHCLDGAEKRAINKFLASPFFNQKAEVLALWGYLLHDYPSSPTGFAAENAFEKVYPGQSYDAAKLRHVMSWLLQCLEEFLAHRQTRQDGFGKSLALASAYREKGLTKHFVQAMRQAGEQLEARKQAPDYFWSKYRLEFEQYAFVESQERSSGNNLPALGKALDMHLLASKLKQSCLQLAHQSVYKMEYDFSFLPAVLGYLEGSEYLDNPAIGPYYYCYRALTEDNQHFFQKFKELLNKEGIFLAQLENRTLHLLAINFCIRQINQANEDYVKEAFELYKTGTESGVLLENGHLSRFAYKNAVAAGLSLQEFGWVEKFIESYKPMLEEKYRDSFYKYNLARLHFTQKNYSLAMPLLVQVDDSDMLLNLDSKVMLLKMYYERNEFDALDSLLASFRTLVNRQRTIGYHKSHYLGIIRFVRRLMELNWNDRAAVAKLRQEITDAQQLLEKKWLLEMVA